MPEARIKLNKEQLKKLEKLLQTPNRKSWTITIEPEDILAGPKSPKIKLSELNLKILTTAYNLQKSAIITLARKSVLQLGRHYFPELVIGNGLGAVVRIKQKLPELKTTNETQLTEYAKQLGITPFAISCIDEEHPDVGIINSDTRDGGGKHWTAVYIDHERGKNYIFDPFGVAPDQRILDQLEEKNPDFVSIHNTRELQNISESNCGQQCIRWLYAIFRTTRKFQEHTRYCTTARTDLKKWWHKMGLPFK